MRRTLKVQTMPVHCRKGLPEAVVQINKCDVGTVLSGNLKVLRNKAGDIFMS